MCCHNCNQTKGNRDVREFLAKKPDCHKSRDRLR
ncbi:hypothetical protein LC605_29385 [Nostoc sp. CHAB 5836]|nr:hypothetical protein [Nostoc sp. CHAB 5836]